jgi:hypothetical protein
VNLVHFSSPFWNVLFPLYMEQQYFTLPRVSRG